MTLTTTEIGSPCLLCDSFVCSSILVDTAGTAALLATAKSTGWFHGATLDFCDRHAYLGALAYPTLTNQQLRTAYAAALALPDLPTAAALRAELVARGASDKLASADAVGFREFSSGLYYATDSNALDGTAVLPQGTLIVVPFPVGIGHAFDRFSLEITATFAASNFRGGVFANSGGLPGALLPATEGVIDSHTATGPGSFIINLMLTPGLWWFGGVAQDAGTGPTVRTRSTTSAYIGQATGAAGNAVAYSRTGVTAGLPTNFGAATPYTTTSPPKVMLRAT